MQRILILISSIFLVSGLFAQEHLIDVSGITPVVEEPSTKAAIVSDTLHPPIFDDFSYYATTPDASVWINGGVYVNYTYPIGPPSVGVATFDAVDLQGNVYDHLNTTPQKADSLRTRQLWINSSQIDSTFVTFYYQPQGNGNAPEYDDSLVLKIIGEDLDTVIWSAHGCDYHSFNNDSLSNNPATDTTLNFKLVHLQLKNVMFFDRLIHLQFENYASITGDYMLSAKTNADHWNIDYFNIRDNVTENDTTFPDLTLVKPFDFFLKKYSTVPWSHYNNLINDQLTSADNYIRNLSNQPISTELIRLYVYNGAGALVDTFSSQQTLEIEPFGYNEGRTWKTVAPVNYDNQPNAQFLFEGKIFSDLGLDFKQNNSVFRAFNFANYYARDDGSAEKAYGVDVNGAQVAYKYKTYKKDSLTAIRFHFEKNQDPYNVVKSFKLCVWQGTEDEEPPGTLLSLEEGAAPQFSDALNGFITIPLAEPIELDGDFFIGWEQTSDLMMNVGFDANTINNNKRLYYRVYDNWYLSSYNGSGALMMQPVFGDPNNTDITAKKIGKQYSIYPNPSRGIIRVNGDLQQISDIVVYNALGKVVLVTTNVATIDLSALKNGVYLVKITHLNKSAEIHKVILTNQ